MVANEQPQSDADETLNADKTLNADETLNTDNIRSCRRSEARRAGLGVRQTSQAGNKARWALLANFRQTS